MKVIMNAYGTVEKPSQITEDQLKNIVLGDQKRRSRQDRVSACRSFEHPEDNWLSLNNSDLKQINP